jgi:outer membrane protein TolC
MLSLPLLASAQDNSNSVTAQLDAPPASTAPLTLTLQDAIARARKNNPEYRAALTAYGAAKEDRVQGRAALLPGVNYNAGFLYT